MTGSPSFSYYHQIFGSNAVILWKETLGHGTVQTLGLTTLVFVAFALGYLIRPASAASKSVRSSWAPALIWLGIFIILTQIEWGVQSLKSLTTSHFLLTSSLAKGGAVTSLLLALAYARPLFYERGETILLFMPLAWAQEVVFKKVFDREKFYLSLMGNEHKGLLWFALWLLGFIIMLATILVFVPMMLVYLLSWFIFWLFGFAGFIMEGAVFVWANFVSAKELKFSFGLLFGVGGFYIFLWNLFHRLAVIPCFSSKSSGLETRLRRRAASFFLAGYALYLFSLDRELLAGLFENDFPLWLREVIGFMIVYEMPLIVLGKILFEPAHALQPEPALQEKESTA